MAIRVGINGFGRIGRLVYCAGIRRGGFEFIGVNDLVPSDSLAYLLNHDTMHGRFEHPATATDAGLAMARIYDAIPKDDLSLDAVNPETGFLGQAERLDAFRQLAARRGENGLWTQDNVESFKALRAALDPLHVTDLKGYLSFAGLLGGGLYIAALWVQQTLPEIFPAVYLFLAACFSAPVLFAYFLA